MYTCAIYGAETWTIYQSLMYEAAEFLSQSVHLGLVQVDTKMISKIAFYANQLLTTGLSVVNSDWFSSNCLC